MIVAGKIYLQVLGLVRLLGFFLSNQTLLNFIHLVYDHKKLSINKQFNLFKSSFQKLMISYQYFDS